MNPTILDLLIQLNARFTYPRDRGLAYQLYTNLTQKASSLDEYSSHTLKVARQVALLTPQYKVGGIKLLRDALRMSLKDAKHTWEIAAILEDINPKPGHTNTDGYLGKPEPHPFVPE